MMATTMAILIRAIARPMSIPRTPNATPAAAKTSGTPTTSGSVAFDVVATDSVGGTSTLQHYAFTINPKPAPTPT